MRILVLPADGIGPEITAATTRVLQSLILSAAMMLAWYATRSGQEIFREAESAIDAAIDALLADPQARTPDLGGQGTTERFGEAVASRIIG